MICGMSVLNHRSNSALRVLPIRSQTMAGCWELLRFRRCAKSSSLVRMTALVFVAISHMAVSDALPSRCRSRVLLRDFVRPASEPMLGVTGHQQGSALRYTENDVVTLTRGIL